MGGRRRKKGGKGKGREGGGGREGKGTSVAPQPPKAGDATVRKVRLDYVCRVGFDAVEEVIVG